MYATKECMNEAILLNRCGGPIRRACSLIAAGAIFIASLPGTARALVTSDGEGTHVVEPGVPAFGVNLDGVVNIGVEFPNFTAGTGALISDTHVLTAAHVIEGEPWILSVRFDLTDGPVWIPVKGYAIHPNYVTGVVDEHDVAVLELSSPAPAGVPRYELYTGSDEIGKAAVLTGYGRSGSGATGDTLPAGTKRAGLNRIDATGADVLAEFPEAAEVIAPNNLYADFDSGHEDNDLTPLITGSADLGFGDDEVCLAPGDSGGPAFIEGNDGIFRIAGINGARGNTPDFPDFDYLPGINSSWGEFMTFARVSTNLDFINDALGGNLRRQRIFNDGLTHVIDDGLDAGPVTVENSPAPEEAATTVTLTDAVVRGMAGELQGLVVGGSSLVELETGLIEGSPAARVWENGQLHVSGGTIKALPNAPDVFIDDSWAIFANDNAEVHVSGGTIEGGRSAVSSGGNSQVFITGGIFTAEDQAVDAGATVEIDDGSFSSLGVGVRSHSSGSLTVRGGTFHGDANGGRSTGSSTVNISDGTFTGGTIGFEANETSEVEIDGGSFSGPFALFANSQSKVRISAGTFTGTTEGFQSTDSTAVLIEGGAFHGDANGGSSRGSSTVSISGGTFTGGSIGFLASANSDVEITGGSFTGAVDAIELGENASAAFRGGTFAGTADSALFAHGQATALVFGGAFEGGFTDLYLTDAATVKIHGYGFNLPLGEVAEESGTITGYYFDGTPFSLTFDHFDDSVIELLSDYDAWAAFHGLEDDDALFTADANGNGIPNGLELVFGGNPATAAATPAMAGVLVREDAGDGENDYLKLTYPVTQLSLDLGAVSFVQYEVDLKHGPWTTAAHGADGVLIVTTPNGIAAGVHQVEVWLPNALAPDGWFFARVGANFP